MEFNIRQKKVINAKEKRICCLAAPGSGKTAVLTERVKKLLLDGCPPNKLVCLTFTNQAAEEMRKRIGEISNHAYIGTIHGYANGICIENGIDTSTFMAEGRFNLILKKAISLPTQKFPKIKHLLIDEFQDTGETEFEFISKIHTENFIVFADERQVIYSFTGASDKYLRQFHDEFNTKTYFLVDNYRCPPNVIEFADNLISSLDKISPNSKPVKTQKGYLSKCSLSSAMEELTWDTNWGDWAVLCRTNQEAEKIMKMLDKDSIPYVSFKRTDMDLYEMEGLIKSNCVKVLTIHAAKGLTFNKVIVVGAKTYNDEERRIAYVAATRSAKDLYWCPALRTNRREKNLESVNNKISERIFKQSFQNMTKF